jgi:Tfp pilus assembly protein PilE
MKHSVPSAQRGITLIGLLFVGSIVGVVGVVAAQVVPTALEYQAIYKAAQHATAGATVAEVRNLFDRAQAIDDFTSVKGRDLEVAKENDKVVVSFAYNREIHLAGPAYLVLKYSGRAVSK